MKYIIALIIMLVSVTQNVYAEVWKTQSSGDRQTYTLHGTFTGELTLVCRPNAGLFTFRSIYSRHPLTAERHDTFYVIVDDFQPLEISERHPEYVGVLAILLRDARQVGVFGPGIPHEQFYIDQPLGRTRECGPLPQ